MGESGRLRSWRLDGEMVSIALRIRVVVIKSTIVFNVVVVKAEDLEGESPLQISGMRVCQEFALIHSTLTLLALLALLALKNPDSSPL